MIPLAVSSSSSSTEISAVIETVPRPMRADARRNRASILAAARELFASERSGDVQVEDVARRAGVGVGTVYRHFPDKEALMGELVRERFAIFNERLRAALEDQRSEPFDALVAALGDNLAAVAEDAATRFAFMSGGERVFEYAALERDEFMRLASRLVARAHRARQLRRDFRASDIPMVMCGLCATMGNSGKTGWDWRRYLAVIVRGMRAEA
jgi:AcrR family transcriptional regulator